MFSSFSQTNDTTTLKKPLKYEISKPKLKYEIGMALGTNIISYPLVPSFNLEFGISYQRWKFKIEPKVYMGDEFRYGVVAKVGFVIWKSK